MCTLTFGHFSLIFLATPVMVPPVPAPRTTMSTLPENKVITNKHIFKWLKISFKSSCFKIDTMILAFDKKLISSNYIIFSPWGLLINTSLNAFWIERSYHTYQIDFPTITLRKYFLSCAIIMSQRVASIPILKGMFTQNSNTLIC